MMASRESTTQLTVDTPLSDLPGLSAAPRDKLLRLGANTLGDVAQKLSRAQLKGARSIGPKTIQLLEQAISQAGLQWSDNRLNVSADLKQQIDQYQQQTELLKQAVAVWVQDNRPQVDKAWREHSAGAYGDYLKAQLQALDHMEADQVVMRDFEHQLVCSLNRYQKQQRYAKSREALMDGIAANARLSRPKRPM